jgi:hypothetical protein
MGTARALSEQSDPTGLDAENGAAALNIIRELVCFSPARVRNTRKIAISACFIVGYVMNVPLRSVREIKFWK